MRIAHVRERHAPAGSPWRLAAALPADSGWLDLELARRRLASRDERLAHNDPLFRQPVSTLDDHLARGLRVARLGALVDGFEAEGDEDAAVLDAGDLLFGPPILRPPSLRDFYAFEDHVRTMWERRGGTVPEAWYRLPIFYFSNTSEIRGPGDAVWAPRESEELDFELEVAGLVDTPAVDLTADRAEEALGGYMILNDWSARDLQRDRGHRHQFGNVSASKYSTQSDSTWWLNEAAKFTSCYGPAGLLALHRSGLLLSSFHSLCRHWKRRV